MPTVRRAPGAPRLPVVLGAVLVVASVATPLVGQEARDSRPPSADTADAGDGEGDWDVTVPRGETRDIDFTTDEGTWMSVDRTPDGRWIVFDLLGHVYRMPGDGGEAEALTQDSGVAVNFHPAVSPDGERVAFVSDRGGQNNLWVMGIDGSDPRPVFEDDDVRVRQPTWSPDGDYIYVRRDDLSGGGNGIWMYHREGGRGVEIVGPEHPGASWPSPSEDGRHLYFQERTPGSPVFWTRDEAFRPGGTGAPLGRATGAHLQGAVSDVLQGALQVRRLHLGTGEVTPVTDGHATRQLRLFSGGAYAPEVSPDGRYVAFARRIPDGTISFEGHEFGPRTALWLRDLETGEERVLMDPIEQDMAEGMKVLRVLPGYTWSPDGGSILLSQGGRIRELDVESGEVETHPFEARVQREISEQAYEPVAIDDGPLRLRFLRWYTGAPDGEGLAFEGAGRVWVQDLPDGEPRRLTPDGFGPLEYGPAWSPDGEWIAFTTWEDGVGGHLWRAPAEGGEPQRLTETPGEYANPEWSPDGHRLVLVRGSGATERARTLAHNPYWDVVTVPASGGEATPVERVTIPSDLSFFTVSRSQIVRPSFAEDGRIFFQRVREAEEGGWRTALVSVEPDGGDRTEHFTFPFADEILPSPDGRWVAFNEGDNVYLAPFPRGRTAGEPVHLEKGAPRLPAERLTRDGGLYPRWRDAGTLEFGSGPRYHVHHVEEEVTDTVEVDLEVPRRTPEGTVAFEGGRIVTLEDREVIEEGDLVVEGARIACVGPTGSCETADADRVVDARGRTLVPGFVDMHSHFFREHRGIIPRRNYEAGVALAYGVTTNLDNSQWSQDVFPAAEMIETGASIGPRTFSTGDPLYAGDGGRQNELASREVAGEEVGRLRSWGAVSIKQYMQPRREQRQWVTEAAREQGVMVTAEGGDLPYNLGMIMDGHTAWEHPLSYVPLYSDAARFFGQAEAVYSGTLVVGGPGPWNDEYFFQETDLWRDEKLREWNPWRQLVPHSRRRALRPETDYSFPLLAQGMADIIEEGGYGAIGAHGQQHGIASHWEIWMLAEAMGPMGALEVASKHGAYFLGALDDLGTLAEGKLADVLVLEENPLDDIRNTTSLEMVMKGGVLRDADTLDELWPEDRPYGPRPWVDEEALEDDVRPVDWWDRRP